MTKIVKNNIPNVFECYYRDEYENRAHLKREDGGFYIRIKPANRNVVIPVIHVQLPIQDGAKGVDTKMIFTDRTDHSDDPDVKAALSMAGELINRWIGLVSDVAVLGFDPSRMHVNDPEAYARLQIDALLKYEELKDIGSIQPPRNVRRIQ